jgi:hypothetical protein
MTRSLAVLFLAACLVASCNAFGPQPSPTPANYQGWPPNSSFALIPYPVSTEIAVGPNRLLVNLLDASANTSTASADHPVRLRLYDLALDVTKPALTTDAAYMPTIPALPGLYRAMVNFDHAGDWGLEAIQDPGGAQERTGRFIFEVRASGTTPAIGAAVQSEDTPTATDAAGIAAISTDDNPDPDFYTTSVSGALAAHDPFVLVFATPAFCKSATCGPTLDTVKQVAADYKARLTFIHVEPYQLRMADGHLQPVLTENNDPIPVQSVDDWGLQTEPYIFVVGADGKLSAKFEGIAAPEELRAAFDAVATGG